MQDNDWSFPGDKKITVVFVLGGPGSGKGTQCANIVKHFGFTHLSAGDLLRAEIKSGSKNGTMIQNMIKEGKIVPSEVTVKLLQKAMLESGNDKFLIDGFPRNEENRAAFENVTKIEPEFVLFFDCLEEEMVRRLLNRNQGRDDDNIETIRKRFKVFVESSLPVVEYYGSKGKVRKIDAAKPIDEVFKSVEVIFAPFNAEANRLSNTNVTTRMGLENIISCIKWLSRAIWSILTNILSKVLFWRTICRYP
ncbi:UMP-CMP kinase 3 isoform X2 [Elaeis guineensis]|uniref:UMP-CMP kinase n=1 Tax=Elaeis guineensis var. tenera TaxID=51953 RepID=A0A8N4FC81_ELAGV|nr:UMP-CMP kinase 3 isoform X2 [Elaeis guineensis]